jgi:ectoine hydroxylase-related dioxygenase (phytanoyl-CoA dioxygenase family)
MRPATAIREEVHEQGFAIFNDVLTQVEVNNLLLALERVKESTSVRKRGSMFAIRNLLDVSPEVKDLAHSTVIREIVEPILGSAYFPVRGILFDKTPEANWKVPWHQDVTIAVQNKVEVEGFGPWSIKSEVLHVQPPTSVLEQMLSVRIHLDKCGEANGALRVLPGSHCNGRIPEEHIGMIRESLGEHVCALEVGGALLMRPLLLHASSPSHTPEHRRVIHLDFAAIQLPCGIEWFREQLSDN